MTVGLTLGKFAPLHKGHQLLIEAALAQVDKLVIMVYDTSVTDVPLPVRAKWLRTLYPQAEVIEAWDGPEEVGYTPEIKATHEAYIRKTLHGRKIDHFFCSEPYGAHVSASLDAQCHIIDEERKAIPVSATMIRSDPYRYRDFLHPVVYRDLITHAVFLGGPSTGKSTLVEALARDMHTAFMPEYGREYWAKHAVDRRLTPGQLLELAEGHLEREEEALLRANQYLFTDTNAITTYLFSMNYHGFAEPRLRELADACAARYDVVFLCDTDIPYDATWDRSGDGNRQEMQKRTIAFLRERKIPYFTISGSLEERISRVKEVLKCTGKYRNVLELAA